MLSDDKLDLCNEKMQDMDNGELKSIIDDMIMDKMTKGELIDFIESNFIGEDWEWFYDEYVISGGVPDV